MFINYLKIAWRNLTRNRVYSSINILGLALGMAIVLLIGAWIHEELSYNDSFEHHERIVKVLRNATYAGVTETKRAQPFLLAAELRSRYGSDFQMVALHSHPDENILQTQTGRPVSARGIFASPEFPAVLSFRMLTGTSKLREPSAIILSQSQAKALFGDADPMDQSIRVNNKQDLKVTGIYQDIPANTEWGGLNFVMSWSAAETLFPWVKNAEEDWDANSFGVTALLRPGVELSKLSARISGLLKGHGLNDKPELFLHPADRWHLYGEFIGGRNTGGAIRYLWMFGSIGIFVLLLACINFMNLSTARSERRAREVGIRKSVGSLRGQLVLQFLGESVLLAVLAAALAVLLAKLSTPWFSQLSGETISLRLSWRFWGIYVGLTLLVGIIAGSYPALYLSSFNAVKVLKGSFRVGPRAAIPRKVLIVLQFTVSTALIIGTLVVFRQISYVKDRPVGYDRAGLLKVRANTEDLARHFATIRGELIRGGAVAEVSRATNPPAGNAWQQSGFDWAGKDPKYSPSFDVTLTTPEFGKTIGWQVVKGRDFSTQFATDSAALVINEAAAKAFGFAEPVGATLNYLYTDRADNRYHIIGIVKDMVLRTPEETIRPAVYLLKPDNMDWILVKVRPTMSMSVALTAIGSVFRKYNPGAPFDFQFISEDYAKKFQTEERVLGLAVFFTAFAIFISCLGLFGLASFTAERRVREIGVRKVLGASVPQLWGLLSKEFLRLVGISFVIAAPLAWVGMNKWLEGYPYRTTVGLSVFVCTFALALLITILTISWQAVRAATANPVKALRSE